jgi:hypothetical protein
MKKKLLVLLIFFSNISFSVPPISGIPSSIKIKNTNVSSTFRITDSDLLRLSQLPESQISKAMWDTSTKLKAVSSLKFVMNAVSKEGIIKTICNREIIPEGEIMLDSSQIENIYSTLAAGGTIKIIVGNISMYNLYKDGICSIETLGENDTEYDVHMPDVQRLEYYDLPKEDFRWEFGWNSNQFCMAMVAESGTVFQKVS